VSYQVLARKYRPQTFEDVVGQTVITQTLANAIRLDRLGHAFLFSGSRGIGKTTTARILAKAVNCEKGPTPEPCNVCRHCTEITVGKSMDVVEIDGASNRGIDEIRELRENVKYKPVAARAKITIIDEVHMLTREAFNALLKTLEEPPDHVTFILATTEAHKVPITILSRCQRHDFRRIDVATLTTYLANVCEKESIKVEERTLEVLAKMADGGMRDCLSLLDQVVSFSGKTIDHDQTMTLLGRIDPELLYDVFRGISEGNGAVTLEKFAFYINNGGDETVFNREMMEITRDLLAEKVGAAPNTSLPDGLSEAFSVDQLERMFRIMIDMEQSFRSTEFPRLQMDIALVKMSRIEQLTPLSDILAHLKKIERHPDVGKFIPPLASKRTRPAKTAATSGKTATIPGPTAVADKNVNRTAASTQKKNDHSGNSLKPVAPENMTPPDTSGTRRDSHPVKNNHREQNDTSSKKHTSDSEPTQTDATVDNSILQKLIDALPKKAAPVKGMLESATVEHFDNTTLALAFHPRNRLQHDLLSATPNLDKTFDTATKKAFSKVVSVTYRVGDDTVSPSLGEEHAMHKRRVREQHLKTAHNNPVVQKTLRMFRGTIRDVRVRSPHNVTTGLSKHRNDDMEVETDD
jgi:DNA polymerase III subunit gamma/tau